MDLILFELAFLSLFLVVAYFVKRSDDIEFKIIDQFNTALPTMPTQEILMYRNSILQMGYRSYFFDVLLKLCDCELCNRNIRI